MVNCFLLFSKTFSTLLIAVYYTRYSAPDPSRIIYVTIFPIILGILYQYIFLIKYCWDLYIIPVWYIIPLVYYTDFPVFQNVYYTDINPIFRAYNIPIFPVFLMV